MVAGVRYVDSSRAYLMPKEWGSIPTSFQISNFNKNDVIWFHYCVMAQDILSNHLFF